MASVEHFAKSTIEEFREKRQQSLHQSINEETTMSMLANPNDDVFAFIRTSRRACISKRRNSKDDKSSWTKGD
jgi:hypothetical protein